MAKLPTVAIIGRPNTGKSTLFNRLVGSRRAIVSEMPGTTRDPVAQRIEGDQMEYLLMDTGGMGGGTEDSDFEDDVHAQALLALEAADLILFVVNGREELTAADYAVVEALRKKRKQHVPVFLVLTKCDDEQKEEDALAQSHELNVSERTFAVSAPHGIGMDALEEGIEAQLRRQFPMTNDQGMTNNQCPKIAVVGRPNVGKSSLINALMSDPQKKMQARMVSDVPGTTRDTTDTVIKSHGKEFLFLDTAGLKRKKQTKTEVEAYAALRTIQAIEDADVTVLVLDATDQIGRQDKRIASLAIERGTGLILLVNKIDLLEGDQKKQFMARMERSFPFCRFAPVLFTSAVTRENLPKLFDLISSTQENRTRRIETPVLNRWFQDIVAKYQLAPKYITQAEVAPPTFVLFLNDPKRLHFSSLRFMENKLRESFGLEGTPVRWVKKGAED